MQKFAGRRALVTGGGNGIGRAIALKLAREGCEIALIDIDGRAADSTASELRALGRSAEAAVADVSDGNDVRAAVSLGYDKVRFLGPVFLGDTVTLTYTITEVDPVKRRSRSEIKIVNQNGDLVGVAQHILAWVKDRE